jgi:hypothetical protein
MNNNRIAVLATLVSLTIACSGVSPTQPTTDPAATGGAPGADQGPPTDLCGLFATCDAGATGAPDAPEAPDTDAGPGDSGSPDTGSAPIAADTGPEAAAADAGATCIPAPPPQPTCENALQMRLWAWNAAACAFEPVLPFCPAGTRCAGAGVCTDAGAGLDAGTSATDAGVADTRTDETGSADAGVADATTDSRAPADAACAPSLAPTPTCADATHLRVATGFDATACAWTSTTSPCPTGTACNAGLCAAPPPATSTVVTLTPPGGPVRDFGWGWSTAHGASWTGSWRRTTAPCAVSGSVGTCAWAEQGTGLVGTFACTIDAKGTWRCTLPAHPAGYDELVFAVESWTGVWACKYSSSSTPPWPVAVEGAASVAVIWSGNGDGLCLAADVP